MIRSSYSIDGPLKLLRDQERRQITKVGQTQATRCRRRFCNVYFGSVRRRSEEDHERAAGQRIQGKPTSHAPARCLVTCTVTTCA
ncbi:hypothetical protein EVAR_96834_1 [Eumeta japonica]|uniref:Uncharacterized protein n=1 Tax=Eumeta variegata TaxID=151549 RepID=A0A4C1WDP4_EUMVA|nr:hypothetical protein EVAR_96834_1 [Eumeta japonica]